MLVVLPALSVYCAGLSVEVAAKSSGIAQVLGQIARPGLLIGYYGPGVLLIAGSFWARARGKRWLWALFAVRIISLIGAIAGVAERGGIEG